MYKKILIGFIFVLFATSSAVAQDIKPDKKDSNNKLKISTRVQARVMAGEKNSSWAGHSDYNAVDFNFRRIRLGVEYNAGWYGSKVELKGENLLSVGKSSIQEANIWAKPGFLESKFVLGQYKIPFIREQMGSSGRLMLPERAFSAGMAQQQDIGLMYTFNPLSSFFEKKFAIGLSVTNGDGSGHDGVGRKQGETAVGTGLAPLFNWRVEIAPVGQIVGAGKEIFKKDLTLVLGAGGYHTQDDDVSGGPDGKLDAYSVDLTFSMIGVYVNGEYTMFTNDNFQNWYTYQATLGYNIVLSRLAIMPVARYNYEQASVDGNSTINAGESNTDIWFGVNFFLNQHKLKAELFYKLDQDTANSNEVYFQVTSSFGSSFSW
ncbi:MAG: hypothetical protein ABUK01_13715 [Leptospirales bacterium]